MKSQTLAMTREQTLPPTLAGRAAPEATGFSQALAADAAFVSSSALLQGRKSVQIEHNGAVYQLRATKLGKLILTK